MVSNKTQYVHLVANSLSTLNWRNQQQLLPLSLHCYVFLAVFFVKQLEISFSCCPGIQVELRSEGCDDPKLLQVHCGRAYIKVNGQDYAPKRRGHNLVVLDLRTGSISCCLGRMNRLASL